MKKLILSAVVGLSMTSGALYAAPLDLFDYSYTFGDGDSVSGTLEGTLNGIKVTDLQDVTLTYNYTATSPVGLLVGGNAGSAALDVDVVASCVPVFGPNPSVSFNANLNNIVILDSSGDGFLMAPFYDTYDSPSGALAATSLGGDIIDEDSPTICGNWSLTEVGPVPDGGLTVSMMGLALAGLAGVSRKFRK